MSLHKETGKMVFTGSPTVDTKSWLTIAYGKAQDGEFDDL